MDILIIQDLFVYYKRQEKTLKAVDGVDLNLKGGRITALAGESGCGKTTIAKTILGFSKPSRGKVLLNGRDILLKANNKIIRENIQIVFQNPYMSFDPRFKVFDSLYEVLSPEQKISKDKVKDRLIQALSDVELDSDLLERYPHQLSGGQLQRISIARALLRRPSILILDEPTSSLDITTAAKIITLLKKLQAEHNMAFLFISHNLKLLRKVSDFVYIMNQGKIVESGITAQVYEHPQAAYTQALINACRYTLE